MLSRNKKQRQRLSLHKKQAKPNHLLLRQQNHSNPLHFKQRNRQHQSSLRKKATRTQCTEAQLLLIPMPAMLNNRATTSQAISTLRQTAKSKLQPKTISNRCLAKHSTRNPLLSGRSSPKAPRNSSPHVRPKNAKKLPRLLKRLHALPPRKQQMLQS